MYSVSHSLTISEELVRPNITPIATSKSTFAVFGWVVPATILLCAIYYTVSGFPNLEIPWSALAASVACMTCIAVNRYQTYSFVTLISILHLMYYPVAAFLNLLGDEPAVAPDLWNNTDLAMWACTLGIFSMALGVMFTRVRHPVAQSQSGEDSVRLTAPVVNVSLFALVFPTVLVMMAVGSYYVRFNPETFGQTMPYNNIFSYCQGLAQAGIFLQLFRYVHTEKKLDGAIVLILIIVHSLLFLPSGTRIAAFGFLPGLFLLYANYERNLRKVLVVLITSVMVIAALSYGAGIYRSTYADSGVSSLWDRLESIMTYSVSSDEADYSTDVLRSTAGRLSDYQTVGRVIDWTPSAVPFIGTEGLRDIPTMLLPVSIFGDKDTTVASSGFAAEQYGIGKPSEGMGSSPIMILGDLFRRWGWLGIAFGMFIIGICFAQMDRLLRPIDVNRVLFFALFFPKALLIPNVTLFQLILVARELLAAWVIAKVLATFMERYFSKPFITANRL